MKNIYIIIALPAPNAIFNKNLKAMQRWEKAGRIRGKTKNQNPSFTVL